MKRKFTILMLCATLISIAITGCGPGGSGSDSTDSYDAASYSSYDGGGMKPVNSMRAIAEVPDEEVSAEESFDADDSMDVEEDSNIVDEARENVKRIYTGDIELESVDFDGSVRKIEDLVENSGGYFQENETYSRNSNWGTSESFLEAYMTARIPAGKFDSVVDALSTGDGFSVVRKSISSEDVSEQYYDIQTRLTAARSEVERLTKLMEQTKDVSEIISVQQALSDATYKLEYLQGQINGLDSKVEYSTLTISLKEVTALTMRAKAVGYKNKLSESFVNGFTSGVEFLGDLLLAIAGHWLILLIIVFIILLIRRHGKRKRKIAKKQKEEKEKEIRAEREKEKEPEKEKE